MYDQTVSVGMLDSFQINFEKCDTSWLRHYLSRLLNHWLDRENLVHLFDNTDLPLDTILNIGVI